MEGVEGVATTVVVVELPVIVVRADLDPLTGLVAADRVMFLQAVLLLPDRVQRKAIPLSRAVPVPEDNIAMAPTEKSSSTGGLTNDVFYQELNAPNRSFSSGSSPYPVPSFVGNGGGQHPSGHGGCLCSEQ